MTITPTTSDPSQAVPAAVAPLSASSASVPPPASASSPSATSSSISPPSSRHWWQSPSVQEEQQQTSQAIALAQRAVSSMQAAMQQLEGGMRALGERLDDSSQRLQLFGALQATLQSMAQQVQGSDCQDLKDWLGQKKKELDSPLVAMAQGLLEKDRKHLQEMQGRRPLAAWDEIRKAFEDMNTLFAQACAAARTPASDKKGVEEAKKLLRQITQKAKQVSLRITQLQQQIDPLQKELNLSAQEAQLLFSQTIEKLSQEAAQVQKEAEGRIIEAQTRARQIAQVTAQTVESMQRASQELSRVQTELRASLIQPLESRRQHLGRMEEELKRGSEGIGDPLHGQMGKVQQKRQEIEQALQAMGQMLQTMQSDADRATRELLLPLQAKAERISQQRVASPAAVAEMTQAAERINKVAQQLLQNLQQIQPQRQAAEKLSQEAMQVQQETEGQITEAQTRARQIAQVNTQAVESMQRARQELSRVQTELRASLIDPFELRQQLLKRVEEHNLRLAEKLGLLMVERPGDHLPKAQQKRQEIEQALQAMEQTLQKTERAADQVSRELLQPLQAKAVRISQQKVASPTAVAEVTQSAEQVSKAVQELLQNLQQIHLQRPAAVALLAQMDQEMDPINQILQKQAENLSLGMQTELKSLERRVGETRPTLESLQARLDRSLSAIPSALARVDALREKFLQISPAVAETHRAKRAQLKEIMAPLVKAKSFLEQHLTVVSEMSSSLLAVQSKLAQAATSSDPLSRQNLLIIALNQALELFQQMREVSVGSSSVAIEAFTISAETSERLCQGVIKGCQEEIKAILGGVMQVVEKNLQEAHAILASGNGVAEDTLRLIDPAHKESVKSAAKRALARLDMIAKETSALMQDLDRRAEKNTSAERARFFLPALLYIHGEDGDTKKSKLVVAIGKRERACNQHLVPIAGFEEVTQKINAAKLEVSKEIGGLTEEARKILLGSSSMEETSVERESALHKALTLSCASRQRAEAWLQGMRATKEIQVREWREYFKLTRCTPMPMEDIELERCFSEFKRLCAATKE